MTQQQIVAFLLFSIVAAASPGPSNALLTATGANVGILRGAPALFGVAIGMGSMMFAVAFGLGSIILGSPLILTVVKWCGAAFLLWLAWKIARSHPSDAPMGARGIGLVSAASFQWVNPKAWLVCASAAATFLNREAGSALTQSAFLGAAFALASLPSCFPWLAFGALIQRTMTSERAARRFNLAMGALLALSVLLFIF